MRNLKVLCRFTLSPTRGSTVAGLACNSRHGFCSLREDPELEEVMEFLDSLKNYEKSGVPKGAGTDSNDGFDLGRMRRLMELMGNPQSRFKVRIFFFHFLSLPNLKYSLSLLLQNNFLGELK